MPRAVAELEPPFRFRSKKVRLISSPTSSIRACSSDSCWAA